MWQMICIATPFEIRNGANHVTQANAITKSEQPLACLLSGVTLGLDARDDPSTGCDLQGHVAVAAQNLRDGAALAVGVDHPQAHLAAQRHQAGEQGAGLGRKPHFGLTARADSHFSLLWNFELLVARHWYTTLPLLCSVFSQKKPFFGLPSASTFAREEVPTIRVKRTRREESRRAMGLQQGRNPGPR